MINLLKESFLKSSWEKKVNLIFPNIVINNVNIPPKTVWYNNWFLTHNDKSIEYENYIF